MRSSVSRAEGLARLAEPSRYQHEQVRCLQQSAQALVDCLDHHKRDELIDRLEQLGLGLRQAAKLIKLPSTEDSLRQECADLVETTWVVFGAWLLEMHEIVRARRGR